MKKETSIPACLLRAWRQHQGELRGWLNQQLRGPDRVDDAMQEIFIKAMKQEERFCAIEQPRAWLFEVARHHLIDEHRKRRELLPLPDELPQDEPEQAVVDQLTACLPRVLTELDSADRDILTRCDIEGMTQQAYANQQGLSLPAVKSRLLRARTRLKNQLHTACAVRLDDQGQVCCYTPRSPQADSQLSVSPNDAPS